ncbi:MAG: penicillin-binding protein [Massilia sp.]|nr:penicillin-binding protein [Massilia sp.]
MDQDEKQDNGIRQQAKELFGSAGGRARAGVRQAHGFIAGRPRHEQVLLIALLSFAALVAALIVYLIILIPLTPGIDDLKQVSSARPTVILSGDGTELGTFEQGLQERVKLSQVSPHVVKALISTEDHRFYDHHGVDFTRIAGALLASLKGDAQGGSTITQQLARNMFPEEIGRARSINRKLKELITAIKIENTYSKTEILEAYLNTVPFLYNARGIEMAARTYFDKPALRLDVLESATLVGMLKGTYYYNPVTNPQRSLARRNVVLGQMYKHGAFNEARYKALVKRPMRLDFERQLERSGRDNHFTAHVRKWLLEWADENDYDLALDGLIVHTTLDAGLQEAALRAVEKQAGALQAVADVEWANPGLPGSTSIGTYTAMRSGVAPFAYYWRTHGAQLDAFVRETPDYRKAVEGGEAPAAALKRIKADRDFMRKLRESKARLEAGFVAIDPTNGEVKAWVGSRDFARDQFDHVSQATRQPGSTFKPFVYGAALESGLSPEQPYVDAVMDIRAADGTVWRPTDMSGTSGRQMTMRDGLVFSKNTITAQVMRDVGLPPVVKLAQNLGVRQSKLSAVPSLALGTSPVTLLEMVSSYATIAAQGEYRKPVFVRRITDRDGNVIASFGGAAPERAMSQASSVALIDMLRGVVNRGTGTGVRYRFGIDGDVAGKTGTTQNNADGWFILMHPNLVTGAWVGFNDNRVTMRSSYWGQGGHNALLLVGDFFRSALDSGKIEREATFPGGRPAARARVQQEEPEEEFIEPGDMIEGMPPDEAQPQPQFQEEEVQEDEAEEVIDAPMEGVPPPQPQPMPLD